MLSREMDVDEMMFHNFTRKISPLSESLKNVFIISFV